MKSISEINAIMETIPSDWRSRWCGGENGACACMGCVQIGNRMVMFKDVTGDKFKGDPEYIRESAIPDDIYKKYKITKDEWLLWLSKQQKGEQK